MIGSAEGPSRQKIVHLLLSIRNREFISELTLSVNTWPISRSLSHALFPSYLVTL